MARKSALQGQDEGWTPVTSPEKEWSKSIHAPAEEKSKKTARRGGGSGGGNGSGGVTVSLAGLSLPASGGAGPREDPYWGEMLGRFETAYAAALRDSEGVRERAASAARSEAERRSAELGESYDGLDRQLYRDYMEHRRTLPQELAAQGYTGGVSESARVRLHNGYEEAMAENRRSRLRQLSQVERDRAAAEEKALSQEAERSAAARRTWEQSVTELMRARHGEERADELRKAETLARAGDFSGYRALGWSEGEIGYLGAVWALENPEVAAGLYAVYA